MIDSFTGEYHFLSNFYPCKIKYEGIVYGSTEHAFQAAKTLDKAKRKEFLHITANQAKRKGGKIKPLRENWDGIKLGIMEELVRIKFTTHEDLKEKLLATGDEELVEENSHKDFFWGKVNGKGLNWLGHILMKVRAEIKDNTFTKNKCRCGQPGQEDHTCPYAEEIGNDSQTLCNCCDDCRFQCAMDI